MDGPYSRIACCVDRDGMADEVLREARRLAGGSEPIRVVHVVVPARATTAGPFAYVGPAGEERGAAEAWLDDLVAGAGDVAPVLLEGSPAREVCDWARSRGVDLIVAAADRGLVERAMLGGFASYIAYHAPCPVLLVHRSSSGE